ESLPQQIVAAPHRYSDALTKKPTFQIGPAPEYAAVGRVGPIEPEGKRNPVAEQKVHLAALEGKARGVGIGKWPQLRFREKCLQECFVRGACDNRNLFSL